MRKIILLDLNYTLVSNSNIKIQPFFKQIENESYRVDLIDIVKPHIVVLLTARPGKYESATLNSIKEKTGWEPAFCSFNYEGLVPALFKEKILNKVIFVLAGHQKERIFAIESNPITRGMYKKYNIKNCTYEQLINNKELLK